jgi:NADH:ubiquinone oxidoreductase subunit 2 (subunit N)
MNPAAVLSSPASLAAQALAIWPALAMLAGGAILLGMERQGRRGPVQAVVLAALALVIAAAPLGRAAWAPLATGLVIAALTRDHRDPLHTECALKLLWVLGPAFALSWAGLALLTLATGTPVAVEQWAVLSLGLEPRFLWSTALPLAMLGGLVLLGGAPFHFWVADLLQGARPWLAAAGVVTLQVCGAAWLSQRLEGIGGFPVGRALVADVLTFAAIAAFGAGAATLLVQRRPERRIGTLASLNGGLVLAALAGGRPLDGAALAAWGGHLALALTGAATLARFLPTFAGQAPGAPLFRRHPWSGIAGLYALASLAGVPGTPGALLWLASARSLAQAGHTTLLLLMSVAWLAALTAVMRQWRQAFGVPATATWAPDPRVPLAARLALWLTGGGLMAMAAARFWR